MTATTAVPFSDLALQHRRLKPELDAAIHSVIESSQFILGAEAKAFEAEFAAYCGAGFAVGCANGTDALELALDAVGVRPGDEVITVSHTFIATVEAILNRGAIPRFVDVREDTLLIDVDQVEAAVNPRTRAIVPVHLYGSCVDMEALGAVAEGAGLTIIEDAAQAHGASSGKSRAGTSGRVGTFSFYPGKNLGAMGDAGALVTGDPDVAARARQARDHGRRSKYEHEFIGRNSRLDGLQAAVLRVKLGHLERWNERRREIAGRYRRQLEGVPGVVPVADPPAGVPVHHLFVIRVPERESWQDLLSRRGISTGVHYPVPVHLQPALRSLPGLAGTRLPVTERAAGEVLSLPIFSEMTDDQVDLVTDAVRGVSEEIASQRSD